MITANHTVTMPIRDYEKLKADSIAIDTIKNVDDLTISVFSNLCKEMAAHPELKGTIPGKILHDLSNDKLQIREMMQE